MPFETIEPVTFNAGTKIKVIGIGGGGGNAVEHMIQESVQGVDFICANTDAQALARSSAPVIINLGETGLGAGNKPQAGRAAALSKEDEIRAAIEGANMLFITAGMGGGTGTGAAPIVAKIARELNILTVGVVTKPFEWEGNRRMTNADEGLAELEANVDSLIVVLNEQLLVEHGDDITQERAFSFANDVLKNAVGGIAEIINVSGGINVDFEDVRTVMGEKGKAMLGTASAEGEGRAEKAAELAVKCPLLDGVNLTGAKGVLVLISATRASLKLAESKAAMNTIRKSASPDAQVIYGTAYDESLGDKIRVTVVATGLSAPRQTTMHVVPTPMQRTGTDNIPILNTPVHPTAAASHPTSVQSTDYAGMAVPSVWRTRTQATERITAMQSTGMDDTEIPAFLRKQAD